MTDIQPRWRFFAAAILAVVSPLLVEAPLFSFVQSGQFGIAVILPLASLLFAKHSLLAAWLAWGGSQFIWRFCVVFASSLASGFFFERARVSAAGGYLLSILFSGLIVASPRALNVQWVVRRESRPSESWQFSLFDLFGWSTAAALTAATVFSNSVQSRTVLGGQSMTEFITMSLLSSTAALTVMWSTLPPRARPYIRLLAALTTWPIVAFFILAVAFGFDSNMFGGLIVSSIAMIWLGFAFDTLRHFGHRLVRKK